MKSWIPLLAAGLVSTAALRAEAPPQDTIIESAGPAEMTGTDTETTIILHDHVVVTGTGMQIVCDVLTVVALPHGDPSVMGEFKNYKSLLATGHVRITSGDRVATCERAEYFPSLDRLVLSGNPLVQYAGQKTSGTPGPHGQIILNRGQRNAVFAPAPGETTSFDGPPLKDMGFGPGGKSAAPPAPAPAP
jgi:lipopolysaccharide export system protein LptA